MTMQSASRKLAYWDLNHEKGCPAPVSVQQGLHTSGVQDIGIFEEEPDIRSVVSANDCAPGGKYRSILKLFLYFGATKIWTTGTGWLLNDDLVVTAAHCVYNKHEKVTCVIVCIGYGVTSGPTLLSADKQRFVKRIGLPLEWTEAGTGQLDQLDIAFLQLNSPFENVKTFVPETTEVNTQQQFTIVGYPSDLIKNQEPGREMYEMKISRDINLNITRNHMLVYQGDQEGGLSGSPVIRDRDSAIIGVHVRGGSLNSAVVIDGVYGVKIQVYKQTMRLLEEGDTDSTLELCTQL